MGKFRSRIKVVSFLSFLAAMAGTGTGIVRADINVRFDVDLNKNVRGISPLIYGSNSDELTQADGVTFRRSGGNRLTGYNWENNASHAGMDYLNSSDSYLGGGEVPGKAITDFIDKSTASGAASIITLPVAGYVSRDKNGTVSAAETAPSARWDKVVFEKGKPFTDTPDLKDGIVYSDEFVAFLVKKYGSAASGSGVRYYDVDNEPGLWPSTHPRIHPDHPTAVELVQKTTGLAVAVKKVDPKAEIFGGVFYGYGDYADLQGAPDWKTVNPKGQYGWYIDYFLDKMKKASDSTGMRLMDVLDIHWYSEATGDQRINAKGATSSNDRKARLQAPRSLWDSTYTENSWISKWQTPKQPVTNFGDPTPGPIALLPHIFASIAKYFPGTKLSITEYNYGEADSITGGIAAADYLGILGRDGVYASNFWQLDEKPVYVASAFRLFRNFDGKGSTFGSAAAGAKSSDDENASVYASFNSGGDEIHIVALNKSLTETVQGTFNVTSPVAVSGGKVFGFDKSGKTLSEKAGIASVAGNAFTYTLPPLSAYHFVLKTTGALPMALRAPQSGQGNSEAGASRLPPAFLPNGQVLPLHKRALKAATPFWLWPK